MRNFAWELFLSVSGVRFRRIPPKNGPGRPEHTGSEYPVRFNPPFRFLSTPLCLSPGTQWRDKFEWRR